MAEQKKQSVFKRVKRWWKENLTDNDRDIFKIAGLYFVDGLGIGFLITAAGKNKQMRRVAKTSEAKGYLCGRMDTYREIIQDPYFQMNNGMNKLEKQGKAQKF